ncbi:hypothetical protein HKD37_02G004958 [Glycine soja]
MGLNQAPSFKKRFYHVKVKSLELAGLQELGQQMDQVQLAKVLHVDFQLVPTIEDFEGILGCPLGGRKSYLFTGFYPSMARVEKVVKISTQELDRVKQNRNRVVGIPRQLSQPTLRWEGEAR